MTDVAANKALITAFLDALNHQDWEGVQRLCSPAYVHHAPRVPAANLATYIETAGRLFLAFPDMVATVDQMVAEGEYVAMRYTARGTHQGDFYGVAPSGRTVVLRVIGILRVVGSQITEGWFEFDTGEIYAQLREGGASGQGGA
jgi:predicted ester cyclase